MLAYEMANNQRVDGQQVNHGCNRRCCVNPDHLELGTQAKNMAYMVACGRSAVGVKNGNADLVEAQVYEIRAAADTATSYELAEIYGVNAKTIQDIWYRVTWKHLPANPNDPTPRRRKKLTDDNVRDIRSLKGTQSTKETAGEFGISTRYVSGIQSRHKRKEVA